MMYNFKVLSLSYKHASLEIREQVALDEQLIGKLLVKLASFEEISDILVLSTCNRTEVYYSSMIDYSDEIVREIFLLKGLDFQAEILDCFYSITDHVEAVEYLFSVACGLESQVVGDLQISHQIKRAYQLSADYETAGPFLHRLLHTIFFTNKRIVQETSFRSGAASTSYAAVELVEGFAVDIPNPKVLVLGIGEIGADVCRHLVNTPIQDVVIVNRTLEKAQALANECGAQVVPFEEVWNAIAESDIIISSIARPEPFISKMALSNQEFLSFKYFVDLAMPRSIEPEIEELPGVILYNIDQINNKAGEALQKRLAAIPDVKAILQHTLQDFHEWSKEMEISPILQKLKNALEQIRQEEISRYSKNLSEIEAQKLDKITRSMMQKIIKLPALQLKAACRRGEAETLIDVLNDLFNLEKQSEQVTENA
ncbi:MAG: glutamyl-tRNA reductase [Microscillaceae bacterium]|nr:glutamyl-tRNA reductase [Microscillaceae bacterium]